ncbi:hypothetical protein QLL95_gp1001 [Cotonvirus japonicus]|uniref:HNH endonuclease n=1 Tax=Cotonvirus japonicus TaxID=2811091 RepID=A0ABM7NSI2_9VIRU|nr:hypothetical protein QLL95_gp1001 [Cotonvirus japonicus]BCS83122.1 hypothetical protein [Cotonvirus japonicus]
MEKPKCIGKTKEGKPCSYKAVKQLSFKFCKKHHNSHRIYGKEKTHKLCTAHTRCYPDDPKKASLKKLLPINDKYNQCEVCRKTENLKARKKFNEKKEINKISKDVKYCVDCSNKILIKDIIITKKNKPSLRCKKCLESKRKNENKRGKRDRSEQQREYENRPETKEMRKSYRQNNPEVVKGSNALYRQNQLTNNANKYRKRNAKSQAKRRQEHPEDAVKGKIARKTKVGILFNEYIRSAKVRGFEMELTIEQFTALVESDCYYCGCPRGKFLNGIDRKNNNEGYTIDNVVTSCQVCNYMKNTYNEATFILMCMKIVNTLKNYKFNVTVNPFNNYSGCNYYDYNLRANRKNLNFELTKEEFSKLQQGSCYICKRLSDNNHKHGIDRFYNDEGYTLENSKTCCGDCNYLKGEEEYHDFMIQCMFVAINHKNRITELEAMWIPSKFNEINKNKPTKEELQIMIQENKKQKHAKTLASKQEVIDNTEKIKLNKKKVWTSDELANCY